MAISQQLLHESSARLIGFTGGKGRNYLLNQMASELAHFGKKVVIAHFDRQILAPSGYILYDKNEKTLVKKIEEKLDQQPVIFAATATQDHLVVGISPGTVERLSNSTKIDYIFLILGSEKKFSILSQKEITDHGKLKYLDQLIYVFQLDLIDQPLNGHMTTNLPVFIKNFPEKSLTQETIVAYLTHPEKGAMKLFQKKWPTYLIFTDVNNMLLENRCINIARDLYSKNISHIFQSNLKDNIVKRIPSK